MPLEVADGRSVEALTIPLEREGTIAGTLTDSAGRPLVAAFVRALQLSYEEGRRYLKQVAGLAMTAGYAAQNAAKPLDEAGAFAL